MGQIIDLGNMLEFAHGYITALSHIAPTLSNTWLHPQSLAAWVQALTALISLGILIAVQRAANKDKRERIRLDAYDLLSTLHETADRLRIKHLERFKLAEPHLDPAKREDLRVEMIATMKRIEEAHELAQRAIDRTESWFPYSTSATARGVADIRRGLASEERIINTKLTIAEMDASKASGQ